MEAAVLSPAEAARVLVVSRDSALLCALWSKEKLCRWALDVVSTPWEAIDKFQSGATHDLLLLDLSQENGEGIHILRWLRRLRPTLPIVTIGQTGDATRRAEWISLGASECVDSTLDEKHLEEAIRSNVAKQIRRPVAEITSDDVEPVGGGRFYIAASAEMRKLREQAALLAQTNAPVLILGEPGSGKETFGRLIHKLSVRSGFDFGKVTCAALPDLLLMQELFGSRGADPNSPARPGKLELCARGTILLREIAESSLSLQDHLLEVLRNQRYSVPGTGEWRTTGVRILATSSADIVSAMSENRLRNAFYMQMKNYAVHVPSLRDRREEIPVLALHFMHRLAKHYGLPPRGFSPSMLEAWQDYRWPGNLRELEHCVKRYLMLGEPELSLDAGRLDTDGTKDTAASDGSNRRRGSAAISRRVSGAGAKSLRALVQTVRSEVESNAIAVALERTGWNRKAAARLLRVSYRTVLYKIQQYRIRESDEPLAQRWLAGPATDGESARRACISGPQHN